MHYETDQQRFLIVLGGSADRVADTPAVTILDRVGDVVLVETTYWTSVHLRRSYSPPDLTIYCYERQGDARRVFELLRPAPALEG